MSRSPSQSSTTAGSSAPLGSSGSSTSDPDCQLSPPSVDVRTLETQTMSRS